MASPPVSRPQQSRWKLNLGASVEPDGVQFTVWAPKRSRVEVIIESQDGRAVAMSPEPNGYFSELVAGVSAGDRYRYRLDGQDLFPDPCSRFQPLGPHGASEIVDPTAYPWRHPASKHFRLHGQIIYELHIGTFTREGTYAAAERELDELQQLGITLLEIMPLAEFPGRWGWGYDGVDLFAPYHYYGRPEDLRHFIDAAHARGLGVILDVVYNHFGPDGNYLTQFSDSYFSPRHKTDWGDGINYDGPDSSEVRRMIVANACYWISEYRFDGLRLDSTPDVRDDSEIHIIAELAAAARATAGRPILVIGENEPQDVKLVAPRERGGWELDALWADDFHHTARVALTGKRQGYYRDYTGTPQEFISALRHGPLFQGQYYEWQDQPRGWTVRDEAAEVFVYFLQNHDQVANLLDGERLYAMSHPGDLRALTALLLLAPQTPMIFMGQEFSATTPFNYFSDHKPELQKLVDAGRKQFLEQFDNIKAATDAIPLAGARDTFERCKLDFRDRERHAAVYRLHRDLLRIRRDDPVIARQDRRALDGAVLGSDAFALRYVAPGDDHRLLLVNLGRDLRLSPAPEPLLAPLDRGPWEVTWSSESVGYGGLGEIHPCGERGWMLQGHSATLLRAHPGRRE